MNRYTEQALRRRSLKPGIGLALVLLASLSAGCVTSYPPYDTGRSGHVKYRSSAIYVPSPYDYSRYRNTHRYQQRSPVYIVPSYNHRARGNRDFDRRHDRWERQHDRRERRRDYDRPDRRHNTDNWLSRNDRRINRSDRNREMDRDHAWERRNDRRQNESNHRREEHNQARGGNRREQRMRHPLQRGGNDLGRQRRYFP